MKKLVVIVLAVIMSVMSVGCMGTVKPPDVNNYEFSITPDKNKKTKITVAMIDSESERGIIEGVAEEFNKTYPNVEVKLKPFSGGIADNLVKFFNADLKNPGQGLMPDIFINTSFDMLTLSDKHLILNLDNYIKAEETAGTFDSKDFFDEFWKLGQEGFDGGQLMIPRSADRVVVHINKDKFKTAGIDLNPATTKVKNGWTWDDFKEVCAQLRTSYDANTATAGKYLLDPYFNWEAVYNPILLSHGVKYFDENKKWSLAKIEGTTVTEGEAVKQALDLMKELVDNRWVAPAGESQANFSGGEGAMLFHSQSASLQKQALSEQYPGRDMTEIYDVVSFPLIGNAPKIGGGSAGYSVWSNSPNKDYAWQFLKTLTTKAGQNKVTEKGKANNPPIRKDMADPNAEGNLWGQGYAEYNLAAYTYKMELTCPTVFIAQQSPKQANNLLKTFGAMVNNYVYGTYNFDQTMIKCKQTVERFLAMD